MIISNNNRLIEKTLLLIAIVSSFLLPPISIQTNWPRVQVSDVLLPFVACFLLWLYKKEKDVFSITFKSAKNYLFFISIFCLTCLLSIIVNYKYNNARDLFELLKFIKFAIYMFFFCVVVARNFSFFIKLLNVIVISVFIFSFLHYFNVMCFNCNIEAFYASDLQVLGFGYNSIGLPDTKRLLGTMGNPNNNAIFLLFLASFYNIYRKEIKYANIYRGLTLLLFFFCQSRTGLIAFTLVGIVGLIQIRRDKKAVVTDLLLYAGIFLFFVCSDKVTSTIDKQVYTIEKSLLNVKSESQTRYCECLSDKKRSTTLSQNIANNNYIKTFTDSSLHSRVEVWKKLGLMIKEKPILGYGPYKNYFYEHNLYSESEYMLFLWRYGLVGLLMYLFWLLFPIGEKIILSKRINLTDSLNTKSTHLYVLVSLIVSITALTNNPLTDPSLCLFFAIIIGIFYSNKNLS